jgi:hypothetical protein
MNSNFKSVVRKLDTAGLEEREEQRIQKQEQGRQAPQQVDAVAAYQRGLRSYLDAAHREIDVKRMLNDPAELYFRLANSKPHLT